jgi:HlyD family secretion protein
MRWRPIGRIVKTVVAATALALGLWVLLADRYGQFIADGVLNAPLVELVVPRDGTLLPRIEEGGLVAVGQEFALHRAPAAEGKDRNPVSGAGGFETSLVADVRGVLWDWRTTNTMVAQTGAAVADVADCTRLFVVAEASEARVREVKVGDKATFSAGELQWNGSVQRVVAGVPNLTSRLAIQLPTAAADGYLIFVKLEVPEGDEQYCAVGLRGRIEFQRQTTGFLDLVLRPKPVAYAIDQGRNGAVGTGSFAKAHTSWK